MSLHIASHQAPARVSDFVVIEPERELSREVGELAASSVVSIGTPLARNELDEVVPWNPSGEEPDQDFIGFSISEKSAPENASIKIVFIECLAVVNLSEIAWPEGVTDAEKKSLLTTAKLKHIKTR